MKTPKRAIVAASVRTPFATLGSNESNPICASNRGYLGVALVLAMAFRVVGAAPLFPPAEARPTSRADMFPPPETKQPFRPEVIAKLKPPIINFRRDTILIIPRDQTAETATLIDNKHKKLGTKTKAKYSTIKHLQIIDLPKGSDVHKMIWEFAQSGLVEVAQPDFELRLLTVPNDPLFPYEASRRLDWELNGTLSAQGNTYSRDTYQWSLNNTGQSITLYKNGNQEGSPRTSTPGADIRAVEAWSIRSTAPNQLIAVIDSGIRHTHEDLSANIWVNTLEANGVQGFDDDGNGYVDDLYGINPGGATPSDKVNVLPNPNDGYDGHGTFVAGIIAAQGNNAKGLAGIAWNTKIMPLKVAHRENSLGNLATFTSEVVACLNYAIAKNARLVNISMGTDYFDPALKAGFESARIAGLICVTPAGNENRDIDLFPEWPACFDLDNIINVGLSGLNDEMSSLGISNFGASTVHLVAPGYLVTSTYHQSDSDYRWGSGTSYSAPHVTGALALLKEHFPTDTYLQTINRLLSSADRLSELSGFSKSGARLNLKNALLTTSTRPSNDDFNTAFSFSSNPLPSTTSVGSNAGATAEPNEPTHAGQTPGNSIWWTWTPTNTFLPVSPRNVIITAKGSSFSTVIAVYAGSSISTLTPVASSQDGSVVINAQAGNTYRIAVDGLNGASGTVRLSVEKDLTFTDLSRDAYQDIIFQDSAGYVAAWHMFSTSMNTAGTGLLNPNNPGAGWKIFASGDFNRDAKADIAFQHDDGWLALWYMDGMNSTSQVYFTPSSTGDPNWRATSLGDFDKDGNLDILFQHTDGTLAVWFMTGTAMTSSALLNPQNPGIQWKVGGTGDFNSDDKVDILFQHDDGTLAVWFMNGINYITSAYLNPSAPSPNQRVKSVVDLTKNGMPDLLLQNSQDGSLWVWNLDGINLFSAGTLTPSNPGGTWKVIAP